MELTALGRYHRRMRRGIRFSSVAGVVAGVTLAAGLAVGGSPQARAADAPAAAAATLLNVQGQLFGVAATSPKNAWAVGYSGYPGDSQMLIAHWNGTRWSLARNLPVGMITEISMDAPNDAWAIAQPASGFPYVIHWDGRTWSQDTSLPQVAADLNALVTVGGEVWVTGGAINTRAQVMLHRTGGRWYVVPVPAGSDYLDAFAATSRTSIWAGGGRLLHWNGRTWETTSVLKSAGVTFLGSMAPGPDGSVWALGSGSSGAAVSLHWNGKAWTKVPLPRASGLGNTVASVTSIPGGTSWAVGDSLNSSGSKRTALLLHWNGKVWASVKPPATTLADIQLADVTAVSPSSAWAVGVGKCIQEHCTQYAIILHWNGKTWS